MAFWLHLKRLKPFQFPFARRLPGPATRVTLVLSLGLGVGGYPILAQESLRSSLLQLDLEGAPGPGSGGHGGSSSLGSAGATIQITPGSGLTSNPTALAAFNRAAAQWEQYLADPVTITISANLAPLGANILGQASSQQLFTSFNAARNLIVSDNAAGPLASLTSSLPTAAGYSPFLPATGNWSFEPTLYATAANFAALGVDVGSVLGSTPYASITFSSDFAFDYDRSNGIGGSLFDFEGVAIHEIGHALGFISEMDFVDQVGLNAPGSHVAWSTPWDLFRFQQSGANPNSLSQFNTFQRNLDPASATVNDTLVSLYGSTMEVATSTGVSTGNGDQASHWLDPHLSGIYPGVMLPSVSPGQQLDIGLNDLIVLDTIGWNVNYGAFAVPEPRTWSAGIAVAAIVLRQWRRRGGSTRIPGSAQEVRDFDSGNKSDPGKDSLKSTVPHQEPASRVDLCAQCSTWNSGVRITSATGRN
jgi:hypothetical protein